MDCDSYKLSCTALFNGWRKYNLSSRFFWFVDNTQLIIKHVIEGLSIEVLYERKLADGNDLNASEKLQVKKSSTLKSELHDFVSKAKESFKETVNSLDLFEDFLNEPSEATGKPLKQLFDRGKNTCKEPLTTDNIDEVLEFFRTFLVKNSTQVSENENKKSPNFNSGPTTNEKLNNPDTNLLLSTPPSISAEDAKFDLQYFEPNEKSPRSTSEEKGQREIHQYDPTQNNDHEESDDLMTPSYEPKDVKHDTCEALTSKSTQLTREKALDRPLSRIEGKGKKVKRKVHNQNFQITDEKVHSVKSWKTETRESPTSSRALEDEVHSLKVKNQELLAELGQIMVEKTAKEREARKSELFQRIYRPSSPQTNRFVVSTCNDKSITRDEKLGCPNDNDNPLRQSSYVDKKIFSSEASGSFLKPRVTNENANPTSFVSKFTSNKQAAQAAELLVKENDHRPGKEETVKNDEDERNLHDQDLNSAGTSTHNNENKNPTTENLPSIASKKKTSGGERIDQSGNVTGTSNEASASREGNIEQSLTRQIYESLSFSVQQDYSNEKEKISLSNVPPTSVATTLYNNYKLLLLSLGQMLLSSEVTKLMTWATQNFPIVNPQNATHVLFQLDENEVINASDLSQLRHFFESIVRFDLVYVIDAFLLGDYGILRQITASKKRDVNTPQTSQTGTTTRYQNLFNAASNSQFSLRDSSLRGENSNEPQSSVLQQKQQAFPSLVLNNPTPNDAKFVPRSPNENYSSAYGLKSLKSGETGFTASQQVVVDGHVTSKLHYCFVRHDIHEKGISYQVAINAKKDYYILQAKNLVNAYVLLNYLFYVFIEFKYFSRLVL